MELIDVTPEDSAAPVFIEELTPSEQKNRADDLAAGIAEELELKTKMEQKILLRKSALQKLASLGLTQEEIDSL